MTEKEQRHRFCNGVSLESCTKGHHGIELEVSFDSKKTRDAIFDKIREILKQNCNEKNTDRLDLAKVSGELGNCYEHGTVGIHSVNEWVNGSKTIPL